MVQKQYWHKNRTIDQGNKIENPEINPCFYEYLFLTEARIYNGAKTASSISGTLETGLLLLMLSCFSSVRLCATPQTAAHQSVPSLEFSRQEHCDSYEQKNEIRTLLNTIHKDKLKID